MSSENNGITKKVWPGHSDEAHPEVFTTVPPQFTPSKPGQLTEKQLAQYYDQGFLIIDSFFTPDELEPCKRAVEGQVDEIANKLFKAGKVKSLYSEYGLFERLTKLDEDFPGANVLMYKMDYIPMAMCTLWSNERLLNLAEQVLGTQDIVGHPIWNLRTKIPNNEATNVPWHQDASYFDNSTYGTFIFTAWIPLLDANFQNGCMQMLKGGHKSGRVADHQCCEGGSWYVMLVEDDIKTKLGCDIERDTVTCEIPFGGLVIFNNLIPHRSLNNASDKIRWTLDFRWQDANKDVGFFGHKKGIPMRSSTDPTLRANFDSINAINRHHLAMENLGQAVDEFDTTIQGPYMEKWEIVHHNRHTETLLPGGKMVWHDHSLTA